MILNYSKANEYIQKLTRSRERIFNQNGFFGRLLLCMKFQLDENLATAATNGESICWGADFLDKITDLQTDIIMVHELLHVILKHCLRADNFEHKRFNIACDIVVNSIILETMDITEDGFDFGDIGRMVYKMPNGANGANYTAEEVYQMLGEYPDFINRISVSVDGSEAENKSDGDNESSDGKNRDDGIESGVENGFSGRKDSVRNRNSRHEGPCNIDSHNRWKEFSDKADMSGKWDQRITDFAKELRFRDPSAYQELVPKYVQRIIEGLTTKHTDWRALLNAFIQKDICDYSFNPPDRRHDGSDFFIPDFNEKEETVKNILFMIDTSGSISDDMLADAYSEIKSAIEQFRGNLEGCLGFFDAVVQPPVSFESVDDLISIRPVGGGGTDFKIIFEYVENEMSDNPPDSIIILTDGYADFPDEKVANGIPVFWMINNNDITPPWGHIARIEQ